MECKYDIPWGDVCNLPANKNGYCAEHDVLCSYCSNHATTGCENASGLVCNMPLCDEHKPYCKYHQS